MTDATSVAAIANQALKLAEQNENDIESHEKLCAERYGNINNSIREIKDILKWAGGAAFAIILGLLSFLATNTFQANDAARKAAEAKIETLERQIRQQTPVIAPPSQP